jgi:hypothetical protein
MFDITYDEALFEEFTQSKYLYKGSQYVFTFDNRFFIYYYKKCDRYVYIALDIKTGLGSEFTTTQFKYKKNEYDTLVPKILNAIKYTGELKYLTATILQPKKAEEETAAE